IFAHATAGFAFDHERLSDGDALDVGRIRLTVAHTPGHTPDSICLLVTDLERCTEPWFVLTGDTLFVGSVGRPDLGGARAAAEAYESLTRVLLRLDDSVEIYPAHGAGSACGRAMSAKAGSTIGFERRFNPALQLRDRAAFVEFIMRDLPPKPPQFEKIVGKNRGLIPLQAAKPRPYTAREAWEAVRRGECVVDLREPFEWLDGHIEGALHLPMMESLTRRDRVPLDRPKAVLCAGGLRSSTVISALKRHGIQHWYNVTGGMTAWVKSGYPVAGSTTLEPPPPPPPDRTTLDCRGLDCPLPVVKLGKATKTVPPRAATELLATDPGSVGDLE